MLLNDIQEEKTAPLGGRSVGRMDCLSCHTPHPQGQPKLLRSVQKAAEAAAFGTAMDSATLVCLSCHPVAAEFRGMGRRYVRHPIGLRVRLSKITDRSKLPPLLDINGTADPSDDVIGCTTCHYAHASKNAFLLRWSLAELSAACLTCHPDVSPAGPGAATGLVAGR